MMSIKPSKKALICSIAVVIVMFVVFAVVYANQASKLAGLNRQVKQKEEQLANSERLANQLSMVKREYLDAQARLGVLEQGVSTRAYVPTLLRQVEELGKDVNLRVVGVRPKPAQKSAPIRNTSGGEKAGKAEAKKPEPYDKLEIDLEITGRYWDVIQFLDRITSFPKIIAVNSLQMRPAEQPKEVASPELTVELSTTAFILKERAAQDQRGADRDGEGKGGGGE